MIRNFADKETEKIFHQTVSKKLPPAIQKTALRKLIMLDTAETLNDLRVPPANRLEALKGNRSGQYRICFRFSFLGAEDVEITDCH